MSAPIECAWCSSVRVVGLDDEGDPACRNCLSEAAGERARVRWREYDLRDHLRAAFPSATLVVLP